MSARGRLLAGCALLAALAPGALAAQSVRGSLRTVARYLDLRPVEQFSVPFSEVTARQEGGFEFEGLPAFCTGSTCTVWRFREVEHAVAVTQDLRFTAWGFGVQGLSATVQLRARTDLGGDLALPRTDDRFDAVQAYLELQREKLRVRAGRQWTLSGLGSASFDGVEVAYDPLRTLRLRAFAGRSLAPGTSDTRESVLSGLDDLQLLPDEEAFLFGGEVGWQGARGTSLTLRYQREEFTGGVGMLSERASLTGRTAAARPVLLSGEADYDVAFGRLGSAHLTAQLPLRERDLTLELTARRYLPFFEMWTIWGFFSPVAYHEAELRASWSPGQRFGAWAAGAWRQYADAETTILGEPLKDRSWRGEAGGFWRPRERLTVSGAVRTEGPVGAFTNSADAALAWRASDALSLSLRGLVLGQIQEFRLGEGVVLGAGAGADARLRPGLFLSGGLDLYRQTEHERPVDTDWNQLRGWLALQIDFGRDAGAAREGAR